MTKDQKIRALTAGFVPLAAEQEKIFFLPPPEGEWQSAGTGLQGKLQEFLKRYGRLYTALVQVLGPVLTDRRALQKVREVLSRFDDKDRLLCVGSGPEIFMNRPDMIHLDIFPFPAVDVVADAHRLPFADESLDLVINTSVLEHVSEPQVLIRETLRVLKPGGSAICYLPFLVPVHAAPGDFQRWTKSGANYLFRDFGSVEIVAGAGPTSALVWIGIEWAALLLSFGIAPLRDFWFLLLMILTSPIKLIDLIVTRLKGWDRLAAGFYVFARKRHGT